MPTEHAQTGDGVPRSLKQLLIATSALPAAVFGLMVAFTPEASWADVEYAFSPGATLTFTDGHIESISGTFTYNTSSHTLSLVDITLASASPEAGSYTVPNTSGTNYISANENAFPFQTLTVGFVTSLSLLPDPIAYAACIECNKGFPHTESVSGYAAPVPEPSTLAILGAALGLFGFRRRKSRMDLSAPANQSRRTLGPA